MITMSRFSSITAKTPQIIVALIIASIFAVILETIPELSAKYGMVFYGLEIFFGVIFTIEYGLHIYFAENRRKYILSGWGIIDLIAILPFFWLILAPASGSIAIIRVLRLARLAKLSYYNTAVQDLVGAIFSKWRSFVASFYLLFIAIIISSSAMYIAEGSIQPDKFGSIPLAMYWSFITVTTVGYGDISPVTGVGKVISIMTAMFGVSIFAIITGIIANAFNDYAKGIKNET